MSAPWRLEMTWHDICFAHWRADADALARFLPPGVEIDRFDGTAWLSVVPFRMAGVHVHRAPTLPGFHDVPEINLRTYVRCGDVQGVWFFSLDAARPLVVESARIATGLPYYNARIEQREDAAAIVYRSIRSDRRNVGGTFEAHYAAPRQGEPAAPGTLEEFLHERYHFIARRGTQLLDGEIQHRPWLLRQTEIEIARNSLGDIIGESLGTNPDAAYFASELYVRAVSLRRLPIAEGARST